MVSSGISHSNPRGSEFQETNPFQTLPSARKDEIARFVYTDKIVGRLGEVPKLTEAVRDDDLATVSFFC